jgi:protein disulfide-isomerase A1
MRFLTAASLFSLFAALVVADEAPSDVISLTADDFESVVNAEPLLLVEFFAPWSVPSCHAVSPLNVCL